MTSKPLFIKVAESMVMRRHTDCAGSAVHDFNSVQVVRFEAGPQSIGVGFQRHGNDSRPPADCLLECRIEIRSGSQGDNLESLWIGFRYAERAAADGTRRSQDCNAFHWFSCGGGTDFLFYALPGGRGELRPRPFTRGKINFRLQIAIEFSKAFNL